MQREGARGRTFRPVVIVAFTGPVYEDHTSRMPLEQVVHEWDDGDDCGRTRCEGEAPEPLDEGGDEGRGKVGGGHEDVEEAEESGTVADVQDGAVEQRIQLGVKVREFTRRKVTSGRTRQQEKRATESRGKAELTVRASESG